MPGPRIDPGLLESVAGLPLFYPCSGRDLVLPIRLFSPYVTDFWFIDVTYFRECPAEQSPPALTSQPAYVLLDAVVRRPDIREEDWRTDRKYNGQPPVIRVEIYQHGASGRIIHVHRCRRRGPSALRSEIDRLGVFFYRGDGLIESGSGTEWLTVWDHRYGKDHSRAWLIEEVLDKLVDGGLIVTDGSNCWGEHNPYAELGRFHRKADVSCEEALGSVRDFQDPSGRTFRCVGCIGPHYSYGPGLVWQVKKGP